MRIPRTATAEGSIALILANQCVPVWVTTLYAEDFADVAPRLDLAGDRYATIFPNWEGIPLVQAYSTAELTGLTGPFSRHVFLPRDGAIAWLGMMRSHPHAAIGVCRPWAALLTKLRAGREAAAVPTV